MSPRSRAGSRPRCCPARSPLVTVMIRRFAGCPRRSGWSALVGPWLASSRECCGPGRGCRWPLISAREPSRGLRSSWTGSPHTGDVVGIGRAVADAADLKLMEMAIRPAHDGLDIAMDPGQGDVAGHLNATSDMGFDTQQSDGEFVDRRPCRHADSMSGCTVKWPWNAGGGFVDVRVCVGGLDICCLRL